MSFTGASVSLKWFWQQQAFSDSKSPGLPTALLCPFRVPIILGLVFLVFFSFPISSDLKPGRITSTCLSAISTLTLSFWMRIARQIPRDSLEVLHDDRIKHLVVAVLFPLSFSFEFQWNVIYLFICIHFVRMLKEQEQMQESKVSVSQDIFINLSLKLSSNLQGCVLHSAVATGVEVFGRGCSWDQTYVEWLWHAV